MVFRLASRDETKVLIGIAGPSSSGKTYSALELGTGMVDDPATELFLIDTENRRGLHYASKFKFQYDVLEAPYTPARYLAKIREAKHAGAKCIIVDSMSHVHEGPGGILEWHEREITRMVGENAPASRREAMNFAAWAKPKADWSLFRNTITQLDIHLIFCLRAKEKLKLIKVKKQNQDGSERTVNEPTPQGWQPIVTEHFEYEMTALLMLPPLSEGKIEAKAEAAKIIGDHREIFGDGAQISRAMGCQLVAWAKGAEDGKSILLQQGEAAAARGTEALRIWFTSLTADDKRRMEPDKDRLKVEAAKHDGNAATDVAETLDAEDAKPDPALEAVGPNDQDRVIDFANLMLNAYDHDTIARTVASNKAWIDKLPEKLARIAATAINDAKAKADANR